MVLPGTLGRKGPEYGQLAIRRRRLGTNLQHPLVCVGQGPPHQQERRADHHRRSFDPGLAVHQHLVPLLDEGGDHCGCITQFVKRRRTVVLERQMGDHDLRRPMSDIRSLLAQIDDTVDSLAREASSVAAGWVPGVRDVLVPAVLCVALGFQVGALVLAYRWNERVGLPEAAGGG